MADQGNYSADQVQALRKQLANTNESWFDRFMEGIANHTDGLTAALAGTVRTPRTELERQIRAATAGMGDQDLQGQIDQRRAGADSTKFETGLKKFDTGQTILRNNGSQIGNAGQMDSILNQINEGKTPIVPGMVAPGADPVTGAPPTNQQALDDQMVRLMPAPEIAATETRPGSTTTFYDKRTGKRVGDQIESPFREFKSAGDSLDDVMAAVDKNNQTKGRPQIILEGPNKTHTLRQVGPGQYAIEPVKPGSDFGDVLGQLVAGRAGGPASPAAPGAAATPSRSAAFSGGGGAKQLDKATAAAILQEAGGDKNAARQLARQRGYSF